MWALVDGNNFYASVEQVFQPSLRNKPLVIASNNDGCAIARSREAKALGIRMGQPLHELGPFIRDHGLIVRSANFALYGDMSARIVSILRDAAPRVEVYSIDESFVDLSIIPDRTAFCASLRERIRLWTGIPCCVGIGPTATLAKLANKVAKSGAGVVDLADRAVRDTALANFPVADVWGVGPRWAARLQDIGISTAAQLRDAPAGLILGRFGVVLARTQRELQGHPCRELQEVEPDRQQIMVSRSFGERVEDLDQVAEALASFAVRASEKLRSGGLVAGGVWIFANTDPFRPELAQHHPTRTITLQPATSDSRIVLQAVRRMLQQRFLKSGCAYKRAGVALLDLARPSALHVDLFAPAVAGNPNLMATMDRINARFGRGAAGFGATGWRKAPAWRMRQAQLSPHYTTRLSDLPRVRC